jgi:formylglycine-generating enzyme required for sulfatase activity
VSNAAGSVNSTLATVTVIDVVTPADMALIPAGSFTMGDSLGEDSNGDAPTVTVNLSAFFMGENEVTKAMWDEVRTWGLANGYTDLELGAGKETNHPVQTISWWDAVKWCNARSQKEGLTPVYLVNAVSMKTGKTIPSVNWNANGYRLPTEAEWEKAARGGLSGKRFPWGDTISHNQANFWNWGKESYQVGSTDSHPIWSNNDDGNYPYTSPVGSFEANGYGLHDMTGNVWEWCWDWYGRNTYVNKQIDPRGPAFGLKRVFKGGSWGDLAGACRVALRFNNGSPSVANNIFGFRVARSAVP